MEQITDGRAEQPEAIYQELLIDDSVDRYCCYVYGFFAVVVFIFLSFLLILKNHRDKLSFRRDNFGNSPSAMSLAIIWLKRFWFQMITIVLLFGLIIFAVLTTKSIKRITPKMETHH